MIRSPAARVAALALSALACTKTQSAAPGVRFRQPSSASVFRGRTLLYPTKTWPYLVVANQSRNDLTVVDGVTDKPVEAPIKLRTLVFPVADRPTLVATASLGDYDDPSDPTTAKPDVLVAVSSGDSVLQVVETWNAANKVHDDPLEPSALAVDLGSDVLALAPMPPDPLAPGIARIAAVLAGTAGPGLPTVPGRIAVVAWKRVPNSEAIELAGPPISADLGFEPLAVAAMPDDPDVAGLQTALYVATRDPIGGVHGVAEIAADLSNASSPRVLGARAPTRLVAAARLEERIFGDYATVTPVPGADQNDQRAFAGRPLVPRVYAVLDESGCGLDKPIDCGVVALDASPTVVSGTMAIPHDRTADSPSPGDQFMPYRAPLRIPGRPLALAVSPPPAKPPPNVASDNIDFTTPELAGFMRLYSQALARATTAVAAVASDDGRVYFLDLGRFEGQTTILQVQDKFVESTISGWSRPCSSGTTICGRRLRLKAGFRSPPETPYADGTTGVSGVPAAVTVTPGFTPDQTWTLEYQGLLSFPELYQRAGEAGEYAAGTPWVALQSSVGGGTFNGVVRLWDPRLGVHPGDNLVIKAAGLGGPCVGTSPLVTTVDSEKEFEVGIVDVVPPTAAYPGGAARVQAAQGTDTTTTDAWTACFDELVAQTHAKTPAAKTGLVVSVRAAEYVLSGAYPLVSGGLAAVAGIVPTTTGYVGRPQPNQPFTLQYEDEDALAAACPFETWDGTLPPPPGALACDAACRDGCETLARVRKLRRYQGLSVSCSTDTTKTDACLAAWQDNTSTTPPGPNPQTDPPTVMTPVFPLAYSPVVLGFTFDVEPEDKGGDTTPARGMTLVIKTTTATLGFSVGKNTSPYQANGVTAFDRSAWEPLAGYRFIVSFPGDFVLDTTPGLSGVDPVVIR